MHVVEHQARSRLSRAAAASAAPSVAVLPSQRRERPQLPRTAVAAVQHVVVDLHHHERRVGHNAAQLAGVEGSKGGALRIVLAGVQRLHRLGAGGRAGAGAGAGRVSDRSCTAARARAMGVALWTSIAVWTSERQQAGMPFLPPDLMLLRLVMHQRTSCELSCRVGTVRGGCSCAAAAWALAAAAVTARCWGRPQALHSSVVRHAAAGARPLLLAAAQECSRAAAAARPRTIGVALAIAI